MNFTDTDYIANIAKYLEGYSELKKLSEINKYNCHMLKYYLSKKISYELNNDYKKTINRLKKSTKNYKTLTDKEWTYLTFKNNAYLYTNSMNKGCFPYLEDIILL